MPQENNLYTAEPRFNQYTPWDTERENPKQIAFLRLVCHEAFYGGSAGAGKTMALLYAALQYADVPGYKAMLMRRTFPMLEQSRGLIELSKDMLQEIPGCEYAEGKRRWTFRTGGRPSTLTFAHIEHEKHLMNYQGGGYHFIGMDEGSQFTERMLVYMHSRLRKTIDSAIPLRFRVTGNPGGPGHIWIKNRYILPHGITDRITIRAWLKDNRHLDQDSYKRSLSELDPITRRQILEGDWDAVTTGGFFKRTWFKIIPAAPVGTKDIRYWDFAATEDTGTNDPDWTAGVLMGVKDRHYYVKHVVRVRGTPGTVKALVKQTAQVDGKAVQIYIEKEPGSAGKFVMDDMIKELGGYTARADDKPRTKDVKQTRAGPFASQAEAGNVSIVEGAWNGPYLDELDAFPQEGVHDDQVDGSSGAFAKLTGAGSMLASMQERLKKLAR